MVGGVRSEEQLFFDFCGFRRVEAFSEPFEEMDRHPGDGGDEENFQGEGPVDG